MTEKEGFFWYTLIYLGIITQLYKNPHGEHWVFWNGGFDIKWPYLELHFLKT